MKAAMRYRLDGLESDNLLAFLALLGLLRALETWDESNSTEQKLRPRASWDIENPPLRPLLHLARAATVADVCEAAAEGLQILAADHDFQGRTDLKYSRDEARTFLERQAKQSSASVRRRADLFSALMTDAAVKKEEKEYIVDPTPLCLLFGQGHQHFLDRLAKVPAQATPSRREGRKAVVLTAAECVAEALFSPWHRSDTTFSFRWDPEEDVRYALMAGDPTAAAYKTATQHGANRLAAVGLAVLTVVPQMRAGRVRPVVLGGSFGPNGFSFAWPIWRESATLSAICALLGHPDLRSGSALAHLGVDRVMSVRRFSVGKFMNFSRAQPADRGS